MDRGAGASALSDELLDSFCLIGPLSPLPGAVGVLPRGQEWTFPSSTPLSAPRQRSRSSTHSAPPSGGTAQPTGLSWQGNNGDRGWTSPSDLATLRGENDAGPGSWSGWRRSRPGRRPRWSAPAPARRLDRRTVGPQDEGAGEDQMALTRETCCRRRARGRSGRCCPRPRHTRHDAAEIGNARDIARTCTRCCASARTSWSTTCWPTAAPIANGERPARERGRRPGARDPPSRPRGVRRRSRCRRCGRTRSPRRRSARTQPRSSALVPAASATRTGPALVA